VEIDNRVTLQSVASILTENALHDYLEKHLVGDVGQCLEVGCGSGKLSYALSERKPNWIFTVTDYSEEALVYASRVAGVASIAQGRRANAMIGLANVLRLHEYYPKSQDGPLFDLCFSEGMLNLFTPATQVVAMKKMIAVANRVVAVMPNALTDAIAEKYQHAENREVWGFPQNPDELLARLVEGMKTEKFSDVIIELQFPYSGEKMQDRQFAVVARRGLA
jgi:SAM-dependent methyltransferase